MISKRYLRKLALPALALIVAANLVSCSDDEPVIGADLLKKDKLEVKFDDSVVIDGFTISDNSNLSTGVSTGLVGSLYDPDFGFSKAGFAAQLRLAKGYPFKEESKIDSAFLVLTFAHVIKDSLQEQTIRAYELNSDLDINQEYPKDFNFRNLIKQEIGSLTFNKNSFVDTLRYEGVITGSDTIMVEKRDDSGNPTDTVKTANPKILGQAKAKVSRQLRIPLNQEMIAYFRNLDESHFSSTEAFLNIFKGIYVETDAVAEKGAIYSFGLLNSSIQLYYTDDTAEAHYYADANGDGIYNDTIYKYNPFRLYELKITDFSAKINSFDHQPTGKFSETLGNVTDPQTEMFVLGMLGSRIKLDIPDETAPWRELMGVDAIINKAELCLPVVEKDTLSMPVRLTIRGLDADGNEFELTDRNDQPISSEITGGYYDKTTKSYKFNIPYFVQKVIMGELENHGFVVYPFYPNQDAGRVIIKNNTSSEDPKEKIGMSLIYTKI